MARAIEEIARCPICQQTAQPPVKLCRNGHASCSECLGDVYSDTECSIVECSICKAPFSETPMRILDHILPLLASLCVYAGLGCTSWSLNGHKDVCKFRPIKCQFTGAGEDKLCDWSGIAKHWFYHVQTTHGLFISSKLNKEVQRMYPDFNCRTVFTHYHKFDGLHFVRYSRKTDTMFNICIRHVLTAVQYGTFYFDISFHKNSPPFKTVYRSVIKALPLLEDDRLENETARFFLQDLQPLIDCHGHLYVSIKVVRN